MAIYIGIDVSKTQLDVAARPTGEGWSVCNDEKGIASLVDCLGEMRPELVVLEVTVGSQARAAAALAAAGLPVVEGKPRQVRDFAKA